MNPVLTKSAAILCTMLLSMAIGGMSAAAENKVLKLQKDSRLKVGSTHEVARIQVPRNAKVKVAPDKKSAEFSLPGGNVVLRASGCACTEAMDASGLDHCYVGQDGTCYPQPHGRCNKCGGMNVQVLGGRGAASTSTPSGR